MSGISTHPKELSRENVEKWLESFTKQLERTTSRNDLDRLLLSVERMEFENPDAAGWTEVIFNENEGEVFYLSSDQIAQQKTEKWKLNALQKNILLKKRNGLIIGETLKRSDMMPENGEWSVVNNAFKEKILSFGGEAIVLGERFDELEVAVRVQAFDPILFTKRDKTVSYLKCSDIHLSEDYEDYGDNTIPFHKNVIKNFCNIEIYQECDSEKQDCIGWITIMERCEKNLHEKMRENTWTLKDRKKIAMGVKDGYEYLKDVGIKHYDLKPENILLRNEDGKIVAKIVDYGVIWEETGRKSYRQMGYTRKGSMYKRWSHLYAGSPAFSQTNQLCKKGSGETINIFVLILCEWKTAWSLLFNPIEPGKRKEIKDALKSINAEWLSCEEVPVRHDIKKLKEIISLKDISPHFCLDDTNITKACGMAIMKRRLTKSFNQDFKNLTKNVLDQKETNLCVPISVSILLRWALKELKFHENVIEQAYSMEILLTTLTMVVYPRSLAGLNLNPKANEKKYQDNDILLLLRRLKYKTYFNKSGWKIIEGLSTGFYAPTLSFDFKEVTLHENFIFEFPLTVTGAYLKPDGEVMFHQMILDRVEYREYILQNTFVGHSGSRLSIPLGNSYYDDREMTEACYDQYNLVNENYNMKYEKWYLLRQAYSIILALDSNSKSEDFSSESDMSLGGSDSSSVSSLSD